jgi:hypothetical protein
MDEAESYGMFGRRANHSRRKHADRALEGSETGWMSDSLIAQQH